MFKNNTLQFENKITRFSINNLLLIHNRYSLTINLIFRNEYYIQKYTFLNGNLAQFNDIFTIDIFLVVWRS